jgi:TonB family protein
MTHDWEPRVEQRYDHATPGSMADARMMLSFLPVSVTFIAIALALLLVPARQDAFLDGVLRPDAVTVRPKVVVKRLPPYLLPGLTGPEGVLRVEFVVETDGLVRQARVTQPLGPSHEFEAQTLAAAKLWKFQPAQKDGAPVRMVATMIVTFKMANFRGRGGADRMLLSGTATVDGVDDDWAQGIPKAGPGLDGPRVVKQPPPVYPREVLREKLPAVWVRMEAVVTVEGKIGEIRVIQSSDSRFDQPAIDAALRWQMTPATREGKPTPCVVVVEMEFRAS